MCVVPYNKKLMTPFGEAHADLIYISENSDDPTEFQCWLLETGEVWWFAQPHVREIPRFNEPYRSGITDIQLSDALLHKYAKHILRHKRSPFYDKAKAYLSP